MCREMHSGCYRGFVAAYRVCEADSILRLVSLTANYDETYYDVPPPLFGVSPTLPPPDELWLHPTFENLNEPVRFTGGLIVGRDPRDMGAFYVATFPGEEYNTVYELVFRDGNLTSAFNRSPEYGLLREQEWDLPQGITTEAKRQFRGQRDRTIREAMTKYLSYDAYQSTQFG